MINSTPSPTAPVATDHGSPTPEACFASVVARWIAGDAAGMLDFAQTSWKQGVLAGPGHTIRKIDKWIRENGTKPLPKDAGGGDPFVVRERIRACVRTGFLGNPKAKIQELLDAYALLEVSNPRLEAIAGIKPEFMLDGYAEAQVRDSKGVTRRATLCVRFINEGGRWGFNPVSAYRVRYIDG